MDGLADRVAVVTGAALGVGRAIALAFAEQGAHVAVLDVNREGAESVALEVQSHGVRAVPLVADVASYEMVTRAIAGVDATLGPVDFLVNNAGAGHRDVRFSELPRSEWARVIGVCLLGTLNTTHAVLPGMTKRCAGSIVNIASDTGLIGGSRSSVYSAAKAAVIGHTRALAREAGEFGIRVNVVCPGDVETERSREHEEAEAQRLGREAAEERLRQQLEGYALKRRGLASDVAGAVLFFCSDGASWITGQRLSVNGGAVMV